MKELWDSTPKRALDEILGLAGSLVVNNLQLGREVARRLLVVVGGQHKEMCANYKLAAAEPFKGCPGAINSLGWSNEHGTLSHFGRQADL